MPQGRPGVVLHGEVADAGAFLDGLDIAVNPVFSKSMTMGLVMRYVPNGN